MPTEKQVLKALESVIDPDIGQDIVSLGFIKDLKITGGDVAFKVELTTPACPVKERFRGQCEQIVKSLPGVTSVHVTMTAREHAPRAAGPSQTALDKVNAVIAVSACKGGVGKSTIAVLLARALQQQGLAVGLLDADLYGPSFPTLFNAHNVQVYMRDNMILPVSLCGLPVMSFGFLLGEAPAVMRGPMVSSYIQQILTQTEWGPLDYLIIDMPPGTGDIQLTLTQQAALDGAVIVTTPQALSLADVAKGILMFEKVEVPVLGLVENMSYFTCDQCGKEHHIFGTGVEGLTERFGLSTLARIPILPGLSNPDTISSDTVLGPIRELAGNMTRALGARRAANAPAPVLTVQPDQLHVRWPDGSESVLPNFKVRASCTCARCVDEHTGERLLDVASIPLDIHVESVQPLGRYAVSMAWSDGHASGIYSWEHLRTLAGL